MIFLTAKHMTYGLLFLQLSLVICKQHGVDISQRRENSNVKLLWWTPFTESSGEKRQCTEGSCYITEDKTIYEKLHHEVDGILFYGSDFDPGNLPHTRGRGQWWALLHEESPKNQPLFSHSSMLSLFNFTSTFKQQSNVPLTLQYLKSIRSLTDQQEIVPQKDKNVHILNGLAPIVYIQSDCDTPAQRDALINDLSAYIKIDSYGKCLHNTPLPAHLNDAPATMQHVDLRAIVAKYKFAVAVENAECPDYITEKLWRPLTLGVVPIYWGAPNVAQWLPNNRSIIGVRDYSSPEQLAQHLHQLLANDTEYEKYLDHKLKRIVRNKFLKESMTKRAWGIDNDPSRINFIEHFECEVCNAVHRHRKTGQPYVADHSHYGCPAPVAVLDTMNREAIPMKRDEDRFNTKENRNYDLPRTRETDNPGEHLSSEEYFSEHRSSASHWLEEWYRAKLEAEKLEELLVSGKYTTENYHQEVLDRLIQRGHFRLFPPPTHEEL